MPPDNTTPSSGVPEQPFQFPELRQERVYDHLRVLVGAGIAEFYKDACRHMVTRPPFATTTHLVSHLLREVESALRDVLEALAGPFDQSSGEENHPNEIKAILKALDIDESDPIARAWLELPGRDGLQKRTHRDNLSAPRALDAKFVAFWAQMETILDIVLEKFEGKYAKVFDTLDALAQKNSPSKNDVAALQKHIPNNYAAHQRFFGELVPSSEWLKALRARDFFKAAPPAERFPDNSMRYPNWPELAYVKKMVQTEPVVVSEILAETETSDNAVVQTVLLEIAAILPPQQRLPLIERMKGWMKTSHPMFVVKASTDLIMKFTEEGNAQAALELCATFLEILPDPKAATPPADPVHGAPWNPKTRIDEWQYAAFLKDEFKKVAAAEPWKSFELLTQLLSNFLEYDNAHFDHQYNDAMHISRPAIEEHEQNHHFDSVEDALVNAIRDAALEIAKANPQDIGKVVKLLEGQKWKMFKRIAIFILSQCPSADPVLTSQYLTDKAVFDDYELGHEYAQLLDAAFAALTPPQQDIIFGFIEHMDEGEEDQYRKTQQLRKLSHFERHLSGAWKERYDALLVELGKPAHPDFESYGQTYVGPTSDLNAHVLAEMEPDAMIEYLKTWEPAPSTHPFGSTREGLGRELSRAVTTKPQHFEALAERFEGLDPTYVRSYLQGFHDIDIHNWLGVLSLCEWVMTQPREIAGRTGGVMEHDPDWGWTKRTIVSTLLRGMQKDLIPFDLRVRVWKVIEWVTNDPDPTPEDDARRTRSFTDDPYTYTINTTRGEAMETAAQYALWVYRQIGKTEEGKKSLHGGFDVMPEVRAVLDKHLDSDPSVAVRAVYGRYLPWLQLIDKNWVLEHLDQIMPPGHFGDPLYLAAWSALVMHTSPFDDVLSILQSRYLEAVGHLSDGKVGKQREDRNTRLIEHLMVHYMRERILLADPILVSFWSTAPAELRGYALDFIGRNLASRQNKEDEIPADTLQRLQELWEERVSAAEASADKAAFKDEMEAFGWWFASGKFPEKWSADQYLRALEIADNKTQINHLVADRLVALVEVLPVEVIAILRKIVLTERPAWILLGNKDDIRRVLSTALGSPIEGSRAAAEDLINRLTAHGFPEFRDLLSSEEPRV